MTIAEVERHRATAVAGDPYPFAHIDFLLALVESLTREPTVTLPDCRTLTIHELVEALLDAEARAAALQKERDAAWTRIAELAPFELLAAQRASRLALLEAALKENEACRRAIHNALVLFGRHADGCEGATTPTFCTCGFSAALTGSQ